MIPKIRDDFNPSKLWIFTISCLILPTKRRKNQVRKMEPVELWTIIYSKYDPDKLYLECLQSAGTCKIAYYYNLLYTSRQRILPSQFIIYVWTSFNLTIENDRRVFTIRNSCFWTEEKEWRHVDSQVPNAVNNSRNRNLEKYIDREEKWGDLWCTYAKSNRFQWFPSSSLWQP